MTSGPIAIAATLALLAARAIASPVHDASHESLEQLGGSANADTRIARETLSALAQRTALASELRLPPEELDLWYSLIGWSGIRANGTMFKFIPVTTLASGIRYPVDGSYYVFAAAPISEQPGRVRVLLFKTDCDFLQQARTGPRGACRDMRVTIFRATDDGTPLQGWHKNGSLFEEMSLAEESVRAEFLQIRTTLLEKARSGEAPPPFNQ